MIDTDKYEGHSEGGWEVIYPDYLDRMCVSTGEALYHPHCSTQEIEARVANMKLMADSPLLLAEVKRLHTEFQEMLANFQNVETDMWRMRDRIEAILKGEY
tara:strand:- start:906 stop:1208 length:303 start_codon:yes stop_codon:yes gene_type:complete